MYELLYVRGLSRLDTPTFSTINEQNEWFSKRVVKAIDGYYPPYYNNTLTLYDDDLNIFNNINYFRLKYKEKWYYYFIDDIKYISDEAYELYITLDVIQTFMFNIEFEKSHITRKCIKRWVQDSYCNWLVNRDFIRENLSTEIKQLKAFNEYSSWIPFIIVESTEAIDSTTVSNSLPLVMNIDNEKSIGLNLYYYIIPIFDTSNYTILDIYKRGEKIGYIDDPASVISMFAFRPSVVSIKYYDNLNLFNMCNFTYDKENRILTIEDNVELATYNNYNFLALNQLTMLKSKANFVSIIKTIRNTNNKALRNYQFIPQIYDENYIQIYGGEYCKQTGISLSKVKNIKNLYMYYYVDITTSSRIYYISDDEINGDIYLNGITIDTIEYLNIINDAWTQYQANFYGTLTRGKALQEQQTIYNLSMNTLTGGLNTGVNLVTGNVGGAVKEVSSVSFGLPNAIEKLYSIDEQLKVIQENMEYKPNTIRSGNNIFADISLKSVVPITYAYIVPDLETVATRMELYGYKVNEYTNNNLLMINTRYYFDIISSDETIFNCKDYMLTEIEKQFIKTRLSNGLRLWHVERCTNNEMLVDIDYDNVEI